MLVEGIMAFLVVACFLGLAVLVLMQQRLIRDLCDRISIKENVTPIQGGELPPYLQVQVQQAQEEEAEDDEFIALSEESLLEREVMAARKRRGAKSLDEIIPPRVPFRIEPQNGSHA